MLAFYLSLLLFVRDGVGGEYFQVLGLNHALQCEETQCTVEITGVVQNVSGEEVRMVSVQAVIVDGGTPIATCREFLTTSMQDAEVRDFTLKKSFRRLRLDGELTYDLKVSDQSALM